MNLLKGWVEQKKSVIGEWFSPEQELCPRCGSRLAIKTGGKESTSGFKFIGCTNFPKCTYAKSAKITFEE